ncbi:MAG: beta-galactosidase [candidate division Zixibacteria bacterium]|nr:beta-galactosidase [candidate division Zixibacteria bacterium]
MLKITNNKLIIGKEEYYPFSAEMHYFRVSKRHWSICFERIRKAGFRIISTRVPWNLHEPLVGDFDFMGVTDHTKDLVVFLELVREFGLKVILHPGPFIGSDWKNGGYPDFLYNSPEILAKDPAGEPFKISTGSKFGSAGMDHTGTEKEGVFSALHPRFLAHVKRYLGALSDVIKNYIYPKGPVILVKLDNGLLSFRPERSPENLNPFNSDYNDHLIHCLFPEYLKGKYEDIKKLNQCYREKHRDFKDVKLPRELKISKLQNLIKYFDWISFKERISADYVSKLKELYQSFDVSPLFSTDLFLSRDFSLPFNWKASESDDLFTGINLLWQNDYVELTRHLRYFATCCKFPWSSEFAVGSQAESPRNAEKYFPVPPRKVKLLLITALASGIKGFNHYMFVERDHWYHAPLANDGTIRPNFDLIKKFNELAAKIQLEDLKSFPQVGLANYRPYLWFDYLSYGSSEKAPEPFPYLPFLLSKTHKGLSQDLINLKLGYGIPDLWFEESLREFPVLMVPCAEFMDAETQKLLINLARAGKTLILFGVLPRLDLNMRQCRLLSDSLKLQTKVQSFVGKVQASDQEFISFLYGYIRGAKKSQVLAKYQDRPVGIVSKLGKGRVFVLTFDISAQLFHHKLSFLEEVFARAGVQSQIYCDAPQVDLILQKNEKHNILYLINSSPNEKDQRRLILRFNPRKLGIKGKKLRLIDLLGDEVIKTSPEELKTGVIIEVAPQDSRMYLIQAR